MGGGVPANDGEGGIGMADARAALDARIRDIVAAADHSVFGLIWKQTQALLEQGPVDAFYLHQAPGYVDAAILSGPLLIGCEADQGKPSEAHVSAYRLVQCSSTRIGPGPALGVPRGEGAKLILYLFGPSDIRAYWVAETDAEEEALWAFGERVTASFHSLTS